MWEVIEHDHETASGYVESKVVATKTSKREAEEEAREWRRENGHMNVFYSVERAS